MLCFAWVVARYREVLLEPTGPRLVGDGGGDGDVGQAKWEGGAARDGFRRCVRRTATI